jgi:hypothetical protein
MLNTQYPLPFAVIYPKGRFFSSGQDVIVALRLRDGVAPADVERVTAVMDLFVRFAATGSLAGLDIDPAQSGVVGHPPSVRGSDLSFRLERCRFDDAALVLLCIFFTRKEFLGRDKVCVLRSVEVRTAGTQTQPLVVDPNAPPTYPDRFGRLPFGIVDEDPESGKYMFTLTLGAPPDEKTVAALQALFDLWTAFILAGGFPQPTIPPDESYVEPENPLVHYENTVEWTVFKVRADPAAVDALLNAIAAFHARGGRVQSVMIS